MNSNRSYLKRLTLTLSLLALLVFTAYCFHFNADLTDEGFYLYYFQHGAKAVTFNFYHLFLSPVGKIFDYSLIGYRYLSLFGLALASAFLVRSIEKSKDLIPYVISISLGLFYFNLISTFSYNTMVLLGSILVIGLKFLNFEKKSYIVEALVGLICFFVFSARYGSGVFLLMLAVAMNFVSFEIRKSWRFSLLNFLLFVLPLGLTFAMWTDGFQQMKEIIGVITKSSHQNLIGKYLSHLGRFIGRSFLPPLLIFILGSRFFSKKLFISLVIYLAWFVVKHVLIEFDFTSFWYYVSGFIMALAVFELSSFPKTKDIKLIQFLVFPVLVYMGSCLGTNNNIFKSSSYNAVLLFPVIYYFLMKVESWKTSTIAGLLFVISFFGIYKNQFYKSYRSIPRSEQVYVSSSFKSLKGISIDQKLENKLVTINSKLEILGINNGKIFTYPNLPGIQSYLNLNSFGNPWNVNNYENSDLANCAYIQNEKPIERLFVYAEKDIKEELMNCLKQKAKEIVFI